MGIPIQPKIAIAELVGNSNNANEDVCFVWMHYKRTKVNCCRLRQSLAWQDQSVQLPLIFWLDVLLWRCVGSRVGL